MKCMHIIKSYGTVRKRRGIDLSCKFLIVAKVANIIPTPLQCQIGNHVASCYPASSIVSFHCPDSQVDLIQAMVIWAQNNCGRTWILVVRCGNEPANNLKGNSNQISHWGWSDYHNQRRPAECSVGGIGECNWRRIRDSPMAARCSPPAMSRS
jgi:hypothetical protein